MRPEMFKDCIESVLGQIYSNFHVFICYDKIESYEYIREYGEKYNNITYFFVGVDSEEKYKFNLYNNILLNHVLDGFVIFLDDDDIFTHEYCFKIINETIHDDNSILIWKFMIHLLNNL